MLIYVTADVEPVQNMNRMACLLGNNLQIRLPHIAANKTQLAGSFLAQPAKNQA